MNPKKNKYITKKVVVKKVIRRKVTVELFENDTFRKSFKPKNFTVRLEEGVELCEVKGYSFVPEEINYERETILPFLDLYSGQCSLYPTHNNLTFYKHDKLSAIYFKKRFSEEGIINKRNSLKLADNSPWANSNLEYFLKNFTRLYFDQEICYEDVKDDHINLCDHDDAKTRIRHACGLRLLKPVDNKLYFSLLPVLRPNISDVNSYTKNFDVEIYIATKKVIFTKVLKKVQDVCECSLSTIADSIISKVTELHQKHNRKFHKLEKLVKKSGKDIERVKRNVVQVYNEVNAPRRRQERRQNGRGIPFGNLEVSLSEQ